MSVYDFTGEGMRRHLMPLRTGTVFCAAFLPPSFFARFCTFTPLPERSNPYKRISLYILTTKKQVRKDDKNSRVRCIVSTA